MLLQYIELLGFESTGLLDVNAGAWEDHLQWGDLRQVCASADGQLCGPGEECHLHSMRGT